MQFHRPVELKLVRWQWMQAVSIEEVFVFVAVRGSPGRLFCYI